MESSSAKSHYYKILGLEDGASVEEIKKAYRQLSLKYHPDRIENPTKESSDAFIEISKAYRVLTGAEKVEESPSVSPKPAAKAQRTSYAAIKKVSMPRWRNRKGPAIFWGSVITVLLIVFTVTILNLRREAMLEGLRRDQLALERKKSREEAKRRLAEKRAAELSSSANTNTSQNKEDGREDGQGKREGEVKEKNGKLQAVSSDTVGGVQGNAAENKKSAKSTVRLPELEERGRADIVAERASQSREVFQLLEQNEQITIPNSGLATVSHYGEESVEQTRSPLSDNADKGGRKIGSQAAEKSRENKKGSKSAKNKKSRVKNEAGQAEKVKAEKKQIAKKQPEKRAEKKDEKEKHTAKKGIADDEELRKKMDLQIERFLISYIKAYEKGNIISYMRFFTDDATENGVAMAKVASSYEELFSTAEVLRFQIKVLKWQREKDRILHIDGRYRLGINYKSGKKFSGKGGITLLLKQQSGKFLIKSLDYTVE